MKRLFVCLACLALSSYWAFAGEIGYVEDFALARDRAESLKKLIPGTEDYYYYHCLHYLNSEQYEKVEAMSKPWLERFGQTPRLTEIQTRHALLSYEKNPEKSLAYLRGKLGLYFNHQKETSDGPPNLPTTLDPKRIARATLLADSLNRWQNLDNFEDSAFDWLAAENLNWERRRNLLQRAQRPDLPNLPQLVFEDLRGQHPQPFGAFAIHKQMTLAQLDELLKLKPDLLNESAFVHTYITKLHPGADEDWRRDPAKTRAYLDRLLGFVRRLAPVHNPLKAHVLHHRLVLDRSQGTYDRALFDEYLKLPRQQPYMAKALLEAIESQRHPADLNADFTGVTMLPIVGTDEPLVRSYLKHFLATDESTKPFEPYINDVYLRHLLAETKIEAGLGDAEVWASQLPPDLFRHLKERIDIDFAFTNKTAFAAEEPVQLDLFVKNVPTLLVKVYEINTQNFYRTHKREVDTDINLDGLVANAERTHTYTEPPLRRAARRFEFPELNKPGVYVIDFIGSGKSSRALVRKGRLRPLVSPSTAGQRITVVDDTDRPVKDAVLWLGGQEYKADADGAILVPFSTNPGRQPIVLSRGEFACLDYLEHQPESYVLKAGIHVDRESLLTQRLATLIVRPGLYLNGQPVALKLLEEVRLRITATDHDNIATATEIPDFKLFEDRESTHELRVPPRLARLQVELLAKVKSLSLNKSIDLATSDAFTLNGIVKTEKVEDLHLAKFGADYVVELLGRTGELKVDRPVQLALKHRDFKEAVHVTLKTDAAGRVRLGALPELTNVTATGPEGTAHTWRLPPDEFSYRRLIHVRAGETVALPYVGSAAAATRAEFALFELRGEIVEADRFEAIALREGLIELRGLAAGDYDLWLKRDGLGEKLRIRVVDGSIVGDYVLGKLRHMELPALKPVHIQRIDSDADSVTVRLRDASKFARVHVFATRYQPEFSAYRNLGEIRDAELGGVLPAHAETVYLTGRNIGDEYRYILDRKYAKKYPGNMLDRPALLLNPWVLRSTETGEQMAGGGDDFAPKGAPRPSEAAPGGGAGRVTVTSGAAPDLSPNLDFLADASAVLVNLVPDTNGIVKIPKKQLGPHAMIHVVAVDPLHTTYRSTTLAEQPAAFADLRLRQGLDPKGHFTQQKQISVLSPNQPFVLADAIGGRFEAYDSLAKVHALYATLSKDPKLAEFAFVLNWPKLKPEEKRTLLSKYGCHELHFFLMKKDPEFFRGVVRPYLANKKDKTFLDRWLLEEDLGEYLHPWEFSRLNTVERALLAQRIQGEPAKTQRHLNDLLRLLPPNPDRFLLLFETAVKGSALASQSPEWKSERMMEKFDQRFRSPATEAPLLQGSGATATPPAAGKPMDAPASKNGAFKSDLEKANGKDAKRKAGEELSEGRNEFGLPVDKKEVLRLGAGYFADDRAKAKLPAQLYRKVDVTQEWAENNYYHLPVQQQLADLVPVSDFWLDYVKHDGRSPFLSRHLADASRNFTEMMFALAVLDLPFTPGKHDVKFADGKMTFTPVGPVIAFHEEVKPAGPAGNVQILASQNFYRLGDRYRDEGGERFDKFVSNEFVIHTVYGGHIVVTNPTSARQKLSVLIQTPVGSIPVSNGQPTRTVLLDLEPYRTQTIDYFFYFPKPGRYAHFPVHVAKAEAQVASAAPFEFNVVEKPSRVDTEAWAYVSQNGTTEQVLSFLNRENVHALDLEKIAFRMKDRDFFTTVIQLLRGRHVYHPTLWSYGLFHNATPVAREFLTHAEQIVQECGGPIATPLLTIDPVARHQYEHLEYKPLVNARAHSLGKQRQIVNNRLNEHYHQYMKLLSYRKQLTDDDKLAVAYYLLLQDRIEEALATFSQVNAEAVATKMQYDYCAAHLQLFSEEPLKARPIAARYANHPVDRWRNAFAALNHQLDEIEGNGGAKIADVENRDQRQGSLAANEPSVEFTIDAKTINLSLQNVESVRLNYYLMDVELLFSRNPFVQQSGGQFSSIKPNFTQEVKLPVGQNSLAVKLPDVLIKRNLLVEATAGGKTRALPYYANAMEVKLTENYGQLRVTDNATGKPLPKAYVKAYVRLADGTVKFYKDGYTDHRGKFDYASVSTPERSPVARFSLLVLSDEHGALIREASPPAQ